MRLLIDSHVLVWAALGTTELTRPLQDILSDDHHETLVSAATIWELGIKQAAGRLRLPSDIDGTLARLDANVIDVTRQHAIASTRLPRIHGDPFDRMLVAQAQTERLTLLTADRRLADYGIDVLTP